MELLQPHPLDYTLEKAGEVLDNTIRKLAQPGKKATSVVEKAIIKDNSWDSNEFVRIVHPIIIEEKCIHGGKFRLTPMIGSPRSLSQAKERGVYRLLKNGG